MAKQLKLSIPTPCHENWDNMTPVDKGKFCGSCQKQVVDFSNMNDRQVAEFFKKPILSLSKGGSVCGRFMSDQLDRDIEIPKKRIPWLKYFFQFAIPAFLLSIRSSSAKAQGTVTIIKTDKPIAKCIKPMMGDTLVLPEVVITTPVQSPVPGQPSDLAKALTAKVSGPVVRVVNKQTDISAGRDLSKPTQVNLQGFVGAVGMVSIIHIRVKPKKELKNVPLMKDILADPSQDLFKVFPNPLPSGSNLNIELKQTEEGYYSLQLLDQSGQSVHQQEIWIDSEARLLNIDIPVVEAGSYFLVLTNKKSGKRSTVKVILQ